MGDVSNVVFTNGAIADEDGTIYIYYASCDTRMHVATTTIDKMEDYLFNTPEDPKRSPDCVKQRCELIAKNLEILKAEGEKKSAILLAEGEKESTILRAEAKKTAKIKEAEGEAEAILKIKEAEAQGLSLIKNVKLDEATLKLKSYEALMNIGQSESTKIIIPSELQGLASAGVALKEIMKDKNSNK